MVNTQRTPDVLLLKMNERDGLFDFLCYGVPQLAKLGSDIQTEPACIDEREKVTTESHVYIQALARKGEGHILGIEKRRYVNQAAANRFATLD